MPLFAGDKAYPRSVNTALDEANAMLVSFGVLSGPRSAML
jgi:hypothetical protein